MNRFKLTAGITLSTFIALVSVGIFYCASPLMRAQMSGDVMAMHHSTTDCIPGKNCGMDIDKHLRIWQSMIMANLGSNFFNFIATLLVVGLVFQFYKSLSIRQIYSLPARYLYYQREHPDNKLYNFLARIFAVGILQPKLFA